MKFDTEYTGLLKRKVENRFGRRPGGPTDFNELLADIVATTNERLSVSTLKSIWGYVKTNYTPTFSTLSVLARYAGYRDWDNFCTLMQAQDDSGFSKEGIVTAADLKVGDTVRVEWGDGKLCRLRKIDHPSRFEVTEAQDNKLRIGDTLSIDIITVGEKFVASNCVRNAATLGAYIGARKEGVTSISINE